MCRRDSRGLRGAWVFSPHRRVRWVENAVEKVGQKEMPLLFLVFQQERWILQPWAFLLLRAILELRPFQCPALDHQACRPACCLQAAQECPQGLRGHQGCRECPD